MDTNDLLAQIQDLRYENAALAADLHELRAQPAVPSTKYDGYRARIVRCDTGFEVWVSAHHVSHHVSFLSARSALLALRTEN